LKHGQNLSRRALLGFGPGALASCSSRGDYFGKTTPPRSQTLIYEISSEPSSFDPATMLGTGESTMMNALLEGLVRPNLETFEPEAALATHYEVNPSQTEFVFYLRGHARPKGTKLAGATASSAPARWSDNVPITAQDFVRAWQRCVDPANASQDAISFYAIAGAQEINAGKADRRTLAAYAEDDLTLRITLNSPAAHFLKLAGRHVFAAVPRHLIDAAASQGATQAWTQPGRMVSSGAFLLQSWKPYERVVLRRNPEYYDAGRVKLERIVFLPISDGATSVNLYRTGDAHAMHGRAVPPLLIPGLRHQRDFRSFRALRILCYAFNITKPPFDDMLVRYAFNMATDKREITRFLGAGQVPAIGVIPPIPQYAGPDALPVHIAGREYDVLSYDPEAARELLAIAKPGKLSLNLTVPLRPRSRELAQILQKQWGANLGVHVRLVTMEWNVWVQTILAVGYTGVIESGTGTDYADPNGFFEFFTGRGDGSGWSDPEFNSGIDRANRAVEPAMRMRALAECEKRLLRAMPVLPLCFDVYTSLQKPYVRGQLGNSLDTPRFSNVWIDTVWRPS
jgi:ABC-type oligopeptide transport system substrate-binding subunit